MGMSIMGINDITAQLSVCLALATCATEICTAVIHLAHVQPATYTWTSPQGVLDIEVLVVGGELCR
jgi:hypothetical protein